MATSSDGATTTLAKPFAIDEHLARLFRNLEGIRLRHTFTADHLKSLVTEAVQSNRVRSHYSSIERLVVLGIGGVCWRPLPVGPASRK